MTPKQAILAECQLCKGGGRWKCESKICTLNRLGWSALRRIRGHCIECNGDDRPVNCTGRLLLGGMCVLHPFRLGKNPYSKVQTLSPERRVAAIARLEEFRRRTKQIWLPVGLESTITSEKGGKDGESRDAAESEVIAPEMGATK